MLIANVIMLLESSIVILTIGTFMTKWVEFILMECDYVESIVQAR